MESDMMSDTDVDASVVVPERMPSPIPTSNVPTSPTNPGIEPSESRFKASSITSASSELDEQTPIAEPLSPDSRSAQLMESVTTFIKKLEPWRAVLPPSLSEDIEKIQQCSQSVEKATEPSSPGLPPPPPRPPILWNPKVRKAPMTDWPKQAAGPPPPSVSVVAPNEAPDPDRRLHPSKWPYVIEAFYNRQLSAASTNSKLDTEVESNDVRAVGVKPLQRIQINSEILRSELESIANISFSSIGVPVIITPPYKFVIPFISKIKSRLEALDGEILTAVEKAETKPSSAKNEQKCSRTDPQSAGVAPLKSQVEDEAASGIKTNSDKADSPEQTSIEMLKLRATHLHMLYDLVQEDLQDLISLNTSIDDSTLETIAFEDLWHLFKPGEIIYSTNNGRTQLYTIFAVTGGQQQRRQKERMDYSDRLPPPPIFDARFDDDDDADDIEQYGLAGVGFWTVLKLDCFSIACNGDKYGPLKKTLKIKPYPSRRKVTELSVYPIRFSPDADEIIAELEERGRRVMKAYGHKIYEGVEFALTRTDSRAEIDSDVFVDFESYYYITPQNKPFLGNLTRSIADDCENSEDLMGFRIIHSGAEVDTLLSENWTAKNREMLELVPAKNIEVSPQALRLLHKEVVGYVFRSRKWCKWQFEKIYADSLEVSLTSDQLSWDVDLLKVVEDASNKPIESGFDDLVIPKRHRDLLVALVENHTSKIQRNTRKQQNIVTRNGLTQIDLVRGKGMGLIILLHGPPGSGKTSTAETIAAYTRRPLYSITCGDLGLKPHQVEAELARHTHQADKWGCVLLLDEADVFLMQRNWRDLDRNALVSVFLRQLEYYSGILFLTTNRPGVLDEAFKSRIHISLRYPPVDLESTKSIWSNILNRLEKDNKTADIKIVFDRDILLEFAEKHYKRHERDRTTWNGRQIRNAFQTGLALAQYERLTKLRENNMTPEDAAASGKRRWMTVKLTKAIFQNIAKTARDFESYIEMIRGKDTDEMREGGLRDDYNDPTTRPVAAKKLYPASPRVNGLANSSLLTPSSSRSNVSKSRKTSRQASEEEDESEDSDIDDEEATSEEDNE